MAGSGYAAASRSTSSFTWCGAIGRDRNGRRGRERARLEVSAKGLLALDRFEEGLEVPVAEAARAVALDHLEEERRPVLRRLREDLQQIAVVVTVGEDAQPLQVGVVLLDLTDTV